MVTVEIKFMPKDRVIIDGDISMVAIVSSVTLFPDSLPRYQIEWFSAGDSKYMDVPEFRLSPEQAQ